MTKTRDIISLDELGKIPPQAIDMEEATLGALISEAKNCIHKVIHQIKPKYFYKPNHEIIYEAIIALYQNSQPVDLLTVTQQLRKTKNLELVGGAYYITELTSKVNNSSNIEFHSKIIIEKWIQRESIKISTEINQQAYEDDVNPFELLDKSMNEFMGIVQQVTKGKAQSYPDLLDQALKLTIERTQSESHITGVPTGFSELDKKTGGLNEPDLIIIAARPGMGKTALVIQIGSYAAKANHPTAVFSLEMSALQLTHRTQSSNAEINLSKMLRGEIDDHEIMRLQHITQNLKQSPLYIDDTAGITLIELRAKCHMLKHQHGIKLFIIDYLQLMSHDFKNPVDGISSITKGIKSIAKDLEVPIILLSQLSRAVETRGGDKRPILSDLRDSGSIEQDADMVWFIYRPEYYGITQDTDGNSLIGLAELKIAKHRQGALDTILLRFMGKFVKFKDYIHDSPESTQEINFNTNPPETQDNIPF